jgi:hypothetical protein
MSLTHRSSFDNLPMTARRPRAGQAVRPKAGQAIRPKAGQAIVEYVLLLALVTGVVVVFRQAFFEPLVNNLQRISKEAGGSASQGGETLYGSFYSNSKTYKK